MKIEHISDKYKARKLLINRKEMSSSLEDCRKKRKKEFKITEINLL